MCGTAPGNRRTTPAWRPSLGWLLPPAASSRRRQRRTKRAHWHRSSSARRETPPMRLQGPGVPSTPLFRRQRPEALVLRNHRPPSDPGGEQVYTAARFNPQPSSRRELKRREPNHLPTLLLDHVLRRWGIGNRDRPRTRAQPPVGVVSHSLDESVRAGSPARTRARAGARSSRHGDDRRSAPPPAAHPE